MIQQGGPLSSLTSLYSFDGVVAKKLDLTNINGSLTNMISLLNVFSWVLLPAIIAATSRHGIDDTLSKMPKNYIPGKGCASKIPIRYVEKLPDDPSEWNCLVIKDDDEYKKYSDTIPSEYLNCLLDF